jgi:hypothetical protein
MDALITGCVLCVVAIAVIARLVELGRAPDPAAPGEPVRRVSAVYGLRFFCDDEVPIGLVVRVEDALWSLAFAGEHHKLWTRSEIALWALSRQLAVHVVWHPTHASRHTDDGVVLYMPKDARAWQLDEANLVHAFAQHHIASRPADSEYFAAMVLGQRIFRGLQRGEAVDLP